MVDETQIEGASPEQEALLREILAELGSTGIGRIQLHRADGRPAIRIQRERHEDARAEWDSLLLAGVFRARAAKRRMPGISWMSLSYGEEDHYDGAHEPPSAMPVGGPSRGEVEARIHEAAGLAGAWLAAYEIRDLDGCVPAVTLAVAEPHAFLRHGLGPYLKLVGHFDDLYPGSYIEVIDGEAEPVSVDFRAASSGGGPLRPDLECCYPFQGFSRGLFGPGPPPCPVRPRTFDDMLEAFRRNLRATTGRGLDEWRALLGDRAGDPIGDTVRWLREAHGLGEVEASAIATGPGEPP